MQNKWSMGGMQTQFGRSSGKSSQAEIRFKKLEGNRKMSQEKDRYKKSTTNPQFDAEQHASTSFNTTDNGPCHG